MPSAFVYDPICRLLLASGETSEGDVFLCLCQFCCPSVCLFSNNLSTSPRNLIVTSQALPR